MKFQPLQFGGMAHGELEGDKPPEPQQRLSFGGRKTGEIGIPLQASPTIQKVFAGHGPGRTPPVGMRGSIPERMAKAERFERQTANQMSWVSFRARLEDENYDYEDVDEPELHPRTGLHAWGLVNTGKGGVGFDYGEAPSWARFHGSVRSAWRLHGEVGYVPTPNLRSDQPHVSGTRLHEAIEQPETRASPRFHGLRGELPRVFHDTHNDDYVIVDGNHRLSADRLSGKLFSEAVIARPEQEWDFKEQLTRISARKTRAANRVDPDFVERRSQDIIYG